MVPDQGWFLVDQAIGWTLEIRPRAPDVP